MTNATKVAFPNLDGARFMSLTTYKKNGEGVATPVWFVDMGDKLYVTTDPKAWKLKRLRNTGKATVAPCTMRGEVLGAVTEAHGHEVTDPTEKKMAEEALRGKYKFMYSLINFVNRMRGDSQSAFLILMPN